MVDWRGVPLPWVYVHSAICETDLVSWYSHDLWSIGGEGGQNLFRVVVFHRSMVDWRRGVHLICAHLLKI